MIIENPDELLWDDLIQVIA